MCLIIQFLHKILLKYSHLHAYELTLFVDQLHRRKSNGHMYNCPQGQ